MAPAASVVFGWAERYLYSHVVYSDRCGHREASGGARPQTGRAKTFYAREAILTHLDDIEDFYFAEERMKNFRFADAISLADLKADLNLDD